MSIVSTFCFSFTITMDVLDPEVVRESKSSVPPDDTAVCAITGMTDREKAVLERSWRRLIGTTPKDFKMAGVNLLLWMFDNVPNMRARFTTFSANSPRDALIADEMFLAHTQSVIISLDTMVKLIHYPDKLEKKMKEVAKSHLLKKPVIGLKYFQPFQEKFHLFIESHLDLPPDHEEVKLWSNFLGLFCEIMAQEEQAMGISTSSKSEGGCCVTM